MKTLASLLAMGVFAMGMIGCSQNKAAPSAAAPKDESAQPANARSSGSADKVRFATAWSQNADPAAAGKEATEAALKALGTPAKGIVFYVYYSEPQTPIAKDAPDTAKEQAAAAAINAAAKGVQNVGCRARSLVNGGTLQQNAVAVLAIGGDKVSANASSAEILDNRLQSGQQIAAAMENVKDLKLVFALAQPKLSFEAKEGVSVEDFIRGVIDNTPKGTILFGGNSMGGPGGGAQFINGKPLNNSIVALGVGGPIELFSNHTNEFTASQQTFDVTNSVEKWIITLDGKPASEVYRQAYGMKPEEKLTWDDQHPIGVVVAPEKVYLRMVLNAVGPDGKDKDGNVVQVKDKDGKLVTIPPGSLRFVAPVAQGSKIRVLKWQGKPEPILDSAAQAISESVKDAKASGATPALSLLSDCCARGSRLLKLGQGERDEITQAILPTIKTELPVFGFYAYGELGPIRGTYQGLGVQYQQHTFVSTVVGIK